MSFTSIRSHNKTIQFKTLFEKIIQNKKIVKKGIIQKFQEFNEHNEGKNDLSYKSVKNKINKNRKSFRIPKNSCKNSQRKDPKISEKIIEYFSNNDYLIPKHLFLNNSFKFEGANISTKCSEHHYHNLLAISKHFSDLINTKSMKTSSYLAKLNNPVNSCLMIKQKNPLLKDSKMHLNRSNLFTVSLKKKNTNNKSINDKIRIKENQKIIKKLGTTFLKMNRSEISDEEFQKKQAKSTINKEKGKSELNKNNDKEIFLSDKIDFQRNLKTVYQFSPFKGINDKNGSIDINNSLIEIPLMKSKNLNHNSTQFRSDDGNKYEKIKSQFRSHKIIDSIKDLSEIISSTTQLNNTQYRLDFVNKIRNNLFSTEYGKYYKENESQKVFNLSDQLLNKNYLGLEQNLNDEIDLQNAKFKIVGQKIDTIELNSEYTKGDYKRYLNKTLNKDSNIFRSNDFRQNIKQNENKKGFTISTFLNDNLDDNNNIFKMYYHKKSSNKWMIGENLRRKGGIKQGSKINSDNNYSVLNQIKRENSIKKYKISKMKRAKGLVFKDKYFETSDKFYSSKNRLLF